MAVTNPEPWLRGPIKGLHPLVMPVFFSFAQVREEISTYLPGLTLQGLTKAQLWRPVGNASVGFHLKHLAGSIDRLATYLLGSHLSADQLAALESEKLPDQELPELLEAIETSLKSAEEKLKTINPEDLYQARSVGRQALPTTVLGLIVHLAEHTQRHLGQAITLSMIVRHLD